LYVFFFVRWLCFALPSWKQNRGESRVYDH